MQSNKGYQTDFLYQLKAKNNIVDIISKYVHLEKKGSRYWGCCPFHNEKTPSFAVDDTSGLYHCFGCKESGDVITFVQKIESCDFTDAIKILAENAHMEIPAFNGDESTLKKKEEKDRVLKVLDATWRHYKENLYKPIAKKAQDYIKSRGFTKRDLDDFEIGYSVDWNELVEYLKSQGFTYKEMLDSGAVQTKNGRYYDPMGGRLCFPIFNSFNECIGFSARALEKTEYGKYLNTAETVVFKKGRVVFAINLIKRLKQAGGLDKIIIVEGQIDVIAMHRAGFNQTVACMGTALTQENAHELKKLSDKVVLCFDGDGAGQKATLRSIDTLKEQGFSTTIVALPGGMDPDEIIKTLGKEELQKLINNAKPVLDYFIDVELKNYDIEKADQKGKFVKAVLEHFRKYELTEVEPYLEKLRQITNMPIDILRRELLKDVDEKPKFQSKEEQTNLSPVRENRDVRAVKFVLASLIHKKKYVQSNIDYLKLLPQYKDILEQAKTDRAISSYFDIFDVENMPILKDALFYNFDEVGQAQDRYFEECLWLLAEEKLIEKQKKLSEEFKTCQDLQERTKILKSLAEITKQLKEKSLEDYYAR